MQKLLAGEDWIKMMLFCRTLPHDSILDRNAFAKRGKIRLWQWGVRERPSGQVSGRGRQSPWLTYVAGETVATILATLAAWTSVFGMARTKASEVERQMHEPPYRDGAHMWTQLYSGILERIADESLISQPLAVATVGFPSVDELNVVFDALGSTRTGGIGKK